MQPGTSADASQVPDGGLSIADAAAELGVSPNTVRARIRRGELRAEQAHRPQGIVWRVFLDEPPTSDHVQPGTSAGNSQVPAIVYQQADAMARVLEPLVEAATAPLRAELADTRSALEAAREEVGHLRAELEQAHSQVQALVQHATSQTVPGADSEAVDVDTAQRQRPWWRFW